MRYKLFVWFSFLLFSCIATSAQEKSNVKFGKVTPEDFAPKVYQIDSNANAIVIADIGSSRIVGNTKGWFSLEFKRYRRVHILNKNGFDVATEEVSLYSDGDREEQLLNLKAVTYNLEDGSYLRFRNVQLGYNFPSAALSRMKLTALRLYVNCQNLVTFKHNLGYTPEYGGDATAFGYDNGGGAIPRITSMGLNVTF